MNELMTPEHIDILGRDETVQQLMRLLQAVSVGRGSCTFALNGKWGTGKTFVLNMLEREARNFCGGNQFMVFHYNCWQYDYYEEPLTAIISVILDQIDSEEHLLAPDVREKLKGGMRVVAEGLKTIVSSLLRNKLGIDVDQFAGIVEQMADAAENTEDRHAYDDLYNFRQAMDGAQTALGRLSEDRTLVIVVDELDRCLPSYAIKVLERLHHLFYGAGNTVLLMAIDKVQLSNTVMQIFGAGVNFDDYLKKFFDFSLELSPGSVSGGVLQKYEDYATLFDLSTALDWPDFDCFAAALFDGLEIRQQEHLVKKARMVHHVLFHDGQTRDFSFLCCELLLTVLLAQPTHSWDHAPFAYTHMLDGTFALWVGEDLPTALHKYIKETWIYTPDVYEDPNNRCPYFQGELELPQILIGYLEGVFDQPCVLSHHPNWDQYYKNINELKRFKSIVQLME